MRAGSYSVDELEAVAEGYEELREHENKAWIHVRLIDMWRAYYMLSPEQRAAFLLVGILGYSTRQAAPSLKVSHTTVAKRYSAALGSVQLFLNGG